MTSAQANVTPVVKNDTVETVTLKNLVALDIVEQNENLLRAFQLLDDKATKLELPLSGWTKDELTQLIEKKKQEVATLKAEQEQIPKTYTPGEESQLISALSQEFLSDAVATDDTSEVLKKFEKDNGVTVSITDDVDTFHIYKDSTLVGKSETQQEKDSDGDVKVE